jgi:hypothetical protein
MFLGIDTFSTMTAIFKGEFTQCYTLKTEKEKNVWATYHGGTVSFVEHYEEKDDGDHFDMALPYLFILYYWYGFPKRRKKRPRNQLITKVGTVFSTKRWGDPRSHITAEPSLHRERKILVCYKALLIKQYSMQKNLKYPTALDVFSRCWE